MQLNTYVVMVKINSNNPSSLVLVIRLYMSSQKSPYLTGGGLSV